MMGAAIERVIGTTKKLWKVDMQGATYQKRPWTPEEQQIISEFWKTNEKIEVLGEMLGRKASTCYQHARRVMKLPARGTKQQVDLMFNWVQIEKTLQRGPCTAKAISIVTGIRHNTVLHLLRTRRGRLVYVCRYDRGRYKEAPVMVWALGNEKEAAKPEALTRAERARKYRARLAIEEPERLEMWSEKKRLRRRAKSGKLAKADDASAWMMK